MAPSVADRQNHRHDVAVLVQPLYQIDATPTSPEPSTSSPRDDVFGIPAVYTTINVSLLTDRIASTSRHASVSSSSAKRPAPRKRSPEPSSSSSYSAFTPKRIKTEDPSQSSLHRHDEMERDELDEAQQPRPHLLSTSCLFRIDDGAQHLTDGSLGPMLLSAHKRATSDDAFDYAYIPDQMLHIQTSDGSLLVTLPVLRTMDDRYPLDAQPWRATCGEWLLSAARLANKGVIEWQVEASLETGGSILKLDISARLGPTCPIIEVSPTAHSMLRTADVTDLAYLNRFISIDSDIEAERQRRRGIDASAIYANLCPARIDGPHTLQPQQLDATLLPFQRRSAAFILGREGKSFFKEDAGVYEAYDQIMTNRGWTQLGLWWQRVHDSLNYNAVTGHFTQSIEATRAQDVKGALLAEEMGLGKTVEVLALILLNPSPPARHDAEEYMDEVNEVMVQPIKTTLIVAPDVLVDQWAEEIGRHAPALNVYVFTGRGPLKKSMGADGNFQEFAASFDVIIASFKNVQGEFDIAQKERPRSRRFPRKYERSRSPLIVVEFWRVVCDEIQMVGNTTKAAEVVSMIPRQSSLAVSGTPIKRLGDLGSFFRFLRLPSAASILYQSPSPAVLAAALHKGLNTLTTRHLKVGVRDEMTLPAQRRYIMPIDFTAVEQAYYDSVWQSALGTLGMDHNGAPLRGDWQLDEVTMRNQLLLLRQACTHPQIAGRVLGSGALAEGNLRSIGEVLIFMRDQASSTLAAQRNQWAQRVIDRAVYQLQDKQGVEQRAVALAALEGLVTTLQSFCAGTRDELKRAKRVGPGYSFKADDDADDGSSSSSPSPDPINPPDVEKARERSARRQARSTHLVTVAQRHRAATEVLARATHWLGNIRYRINEGREQGKDEDAALKAAEEEAYQAAEALRQELLKEAKDHVDRRAEATRKIHVKFNLNDMGEDVQSFEHYGHHTAEIVAQIKERLTLLDKNAALLMQWRETAIEQLYTPVNRDVSEENADDDQYAEALDTQHKLEVMLEMYRPLLAERQRILTWEVAVGATDRPSGFKELELAVEASKRSSRQAMLRGEISREDFDADHDGFSALNEVDAAKLKHFRQLDADKRKASLIALSEMTSLRELLDRLRGISDMASSFELEIARTATAGLRAVLKHQNTILEGLRRELDGFARLFNQRAEYFKQLQALSDALVDLPVAADQIDAKLTKVTSEIDATSTKMMQSESRLRYLDHLGKIEEEGLDEEARKCIICTDEIQIGILTAVCGHIVCQSCFRAWHAKYGTCPVCRSKIGPLKDQHRVIYSRPEETDAVEDGVEATTDAAVSSQSGSATLARRPKKIAFNVASQELQRRIETTTSLGRYGSKLEMLVKHLIFISAETPGDKTIVFSAFARGLTLVADALRQNGVAHVSVGSGASKGQVASKVREFTQGDKVDVLLLHSEQTSAGLNLMATKNVILLEPLVNSGAERQALGRVHRIGQTKETHVYCYYVKDSVEERILHLAAHRGQSMYLRAPEGDGVKKSGGGEGEDGVYDDSGAVIARTTAAGMGREKGDYVNSVDDLLSCFFAEHTSGTISTTTFNGERGTSLSARGGPGEAQSTTSGPPLSDAEHARQARLEIYDRRGRAEALAATRTSQ